MIGRFKGRAQQAALRVAAGTGRIGRAKSSGDVTAFAGNIRMRAVQCETGAKMVKGLLGPSSSGCGQGDKKRSDEKQAVKSRE